MSDPVPPEETPSSHETAGQFPADDAAVPPVPAEDIPDSSQTSGQFPADEVAATLTDTVPPPAPPATE